LVVEMDRPANRGHGRLRLYRVGPGRFVCRVFILKGLVKKIRFF